MGGMEVAVHVVTTFQGLGNDEHRLKFFVGQAPAGIGFINASGALA